MTTRTLYELGPELDALDAMLQESGGEVTPEIEERMTALLDAPDAEVPEKFARMIGLQRRIESWRANYEAEAKRLRELADQQKKQSEAIKSRMHSFMVAHDLPKVQTRLGTASICNNGGKAPVELACSPEELPIEYQRMKVEADMDALRSDLEAGKEIPGVTLGQRGTHLRIK